MYQIDFHAHYLPGCDHGSDGTETSLKQVSMALEAGVDVMCATPHFYPERENIEPFLSRRKHCYNALRAKLDDNAPKMLLGAEVLCFAGIDKLPGLERLCLEGTDILLLEMPFKKWSGDMVDTVEKLSRRSDLQIVLAHIDRYPPDDVDELLYFGVSAQLNVANCGELFFDKKKKEWIDEGVVVAWGSDIHKADVGYKRWLKCKKRRSAVWDAVMERTNNIISLP